LANGASAGVVADAVAGEALIMNITSTPVQAVKRWREQGSPVGVFYRRSEVERKLDKWPTVRARTLG
jgi:transposase